MSPVLLELLTFCLSDGASPIILVHSVMELQPLKHTLLPPAVLTAILGFNSKNDRLVAGSVFLER